MPHALSRTFTIAAAALFALLFLRAVLNLDPYFDTVAYHLPFAARLGGLCSETCYRMGDYLEAAYDGFPKLIHLLRGWLWKITGNPQYADLINLGALALFCVFLQRCFQVPLAWAFCALIAVPLIQIHATSTYVDLPVNLAVAAAILSMLILWRTPERYGWRHLLLALACLAFAANSKPQMIGVALPLLGALGLAALFRMRRNRAALLAVLTAGGLVIAFTFILNTITLGNPFYPLQIELFGRILAGPIEAMHIGEDSLAQVWLSVPSPLRWLASVLEIGAYDFRAAPWTYDQGYCVDAMAWKDCARGVGHSFRMGGYFVPYVLGLIGLLYWLTRTQRTPIVLLAAVSLFVAVLPRSHELRYYLFWMIVLIGLVLIAAFDRDAKPEGRNAAGALILICLTAVLSLTFGRYVDPRGLDVREVIAARGIDTAVAKIPDGAVACVDPAWQPFTGLFAAVHHPGRSYGVLDGPIGDCSVTVPAPPEE